MANYQSAIKRIRKARRQTLYNRQYKKMIKEAVKSVRLAEDYEKASENLKKAESVLDKAATKNILHKNNASRKKASLAKHVKSLREA